MTEFQKDNSYPGLYLRTTTGVYYVMRKKKGLRPLRASTGETSRARAKTKADVLVRRWLGGEAVGIRTFSEVADEALASFTGRDGTVYNAKRYIGELKAHWGPLNVQAITRAQFNDWLQRFRKKKDRETFMDYAKYFNVVMRYAYEARYVSHLVTIPNPDPKKETGRVYTDEEFAAVFKEASPALRVQLLMASFCAMRLREILYLSWDRVDLEAGKITLRAEDVKTGRAAAKRRAGIKGKARFHDWRHTCLNRWLVVEKRNPLLVSAYAGVSIRTIEAVYLHVSEEHTREIAEAVRI
jgi:integrase